MFRVKKLGLAQLLQAGILQRFAPGPDRCHREAHSRPSSGDGNVRRLSDTCIHNYANVRGNSDD